MAALPPELNSTLKTHLIKAALLVWLSGAGWRSVQAQGLPPLPYQYSLGQTCFPDTSQSPGFVYSISTFGKSQIGVLGAFGKSITLPGLPALPFAANLNNYFVGAISPAGTWLWAKRIVAVLNTGSLNIAAGPGGCVYATTAYIPAQTVDGIHILAGVSLLKFSCTGKLLWAKKLPLKNTDNIPFLATSGNRLLITGRVSSVTAFGQDTIRLVNSAPVGIFLICDTAGRYIHARGLSGRTHAGAATTGYTGQPYVLSNGHYQVGMFGQDVPYAGDTMRLNKSYFGEMDTAGHELGLVQMPYFSDVSTSYATMSLPTDDGFYQSGFFLGSFTADGVPYTTRPRTADQFFMRLNRRGQIKYFVQGRGPNQISKVTITPLPGKRALLTGLYDPFIQSGVFPSYRMSTILDTVYFQYKSSAFTRSAGQMQGRGALLVDSMGRPLAQESQFPLWETYLLPNGSMLGNISFIDTDTTLGAFSMQRGSGIAVLGPGYCPTPEPTALAYNRADTSLSMPGLQGCVRVRYLHNDAALATDTILRLNLTLPRDTGWYQARLTLANGCDTLTNRLYVADTGRLVTGARTHSPKKNLHAWPNPTAGWVTVYCPETGDLWLIAADGRRLWRRACTREEAVEADLTELPPGMYVLRLGNEYVRIARE